MSPDSQADSLGGGRGHTGHQLPPTPSGGICFLACCGWGPHRNNSDTWLCPRHSDVRTLWSGPRQTPRAHSWAEICSPMVPRLQDHSEWVGRLCPLQAPNPSGGGNSIVPSVRLRWKVESTEPWDLTTDRQEQQGRGLGGPSQDVVAGTADRGTPPPPRPSPSRPVAPPAQVSRLGPRTLQVPHRQNT